MKKLFTLLTLLLCAVSGVWADEICSAQVPTGQTGTFSNKEGIAATGCTLMYSGLQGGSNAVTVGGVDYYKLGSNSAYVQLKLTSGNFQAGDVLKATVTSNGDNKTVNLKVKESYTGTVKVSSTETKNIEYTLKAADIEEDGSIMIYRGNSSASNLRVAIFSVSRSTETFTVTFDAGSNGTCATASLTEVSPAAGVTLPDVTANSGFSFRGWYTSATGGTKAGVAGETYNPSSNITLYAQYDINRSGFNSYYVANEEIVNSNEKIFCDNITMEYGQAVYSAAVADNMLSSINAKYVASVTTSTNGWGVTFTPATNGKLSVGVYIYAGKVFSITNVTSFDYNGKEAPTDDPTATTDNSGTIEGNEWTTPGDKVEYSIITINVTAGTSYTFSVAGSKMRFYGFEFTPTNVSPAIGSTGWATFVAPAALDFTGISDLKAYIVTGHIGTAIDVEQMIGTVPANTPLLLEGVTTSVPVVASSSTDVSANLLKAGGAEVSPEANKTKYALSVEAGVATFKKIVAATTIPAGKAYLEFTGDVPAPSLSFGSGETTGISTTNFTNDTNNGEYYNLAGQRVAQPTKGLYIVNGKKYMVK